MIWHGLLRGLMTQKARMNGFVGHLCAHNLYANLARSTSWGLWDEWDDTALQTQDSKFEHRWSEAEHGLSVTEVPHDNKYLQVSEELKRFVSLKLECKKGDEPAISIAIIVDTMTYL